MDESERTFVAEQMARADAVRLLQDRLAEVSAERDQLARVAQLAEQTRFVLGAAIVLDLLAVVVLILAMAD